MCAKRSWSDERILPFSPQHVFSVIADVEAYPDFLPWCHRLEVVWRAGNKMTAEVTIAFKYMKMRYTSEIEFLAPSDSKSGFIKVSSTNGVFRYMNNLWQFHHHSDGSRVSFCIEYEFRSIITHTLVSSVYSMAQKKVMTAFWERCISMNNQKKK